MNASLARSLLLAGLLWTITTDEATAQGALFTASPKLTCFGMDEDTYKLVKTTYTGADAISWLTGSLTAISDAWELVYVQDIRTFRVIDRCAETEMDHLAEASACTPDSPLAKQHHSCLYEIFDLVNVRNDGQLLCDLRETFAADAARNKTSATCRGQMEIFGFPCQIELKISKQHDTKGCP